MIEYFVFKESIIEFLCKERNNPENDCQGMCYVQAQLEEQQKQTAQTSLLQLDDLPLLNIPSANSEYRIYPKLLSSLGKTDTNPFSKINADIFHPPRG